MSMTRPKSGAKSPGKDGDSRLSERERPPIAVDIGLTLKDFCEARVIRRRRVGHSEVAAISAATLPFVGF